VVYQSHLFDKALLNGTLPHDGKHAIFADPTCWQPEEELNEEV